MNRFLSLIGFLALVGSISCINYDLASITNGSVTFAEARQGCEGIGMELYEPVSEAKDKALMEFLKANGISSVWLGGIRVSEDEFEWLHDKNSMTYTDFLRGRPLASETRRNCMHMHWNDEEDTFGWVDSDCDDVHRYICVKNTQQKKTEMPYPVLPAHSVIGGHFVQQFDLRTFSEGEQTCRERGMTMVKPSNWYANVDLQDAIRDSGIESVYLGAKKGPFDSFYWTDSSYPVFFNNYGPGVPHNPREGRDCLVMYRDGRWYDRKCDESHVIICQSIWGP